MHLYVYMYSRTSLIHPLKIWAPRLSINLYADLADNIGSTAVTAYVYCILRYRLISNLSYWYPLVPRYPDKRGFAVGN